MVKRYDEPYHPTSSRELKTVVMVGIAVASREKMLSVKIMNELESSPLLTNDSVVESDLNASGDLL